jgi:hypothetical protein
MMIPPEYKKSNQKEAKRTIKVFYSAPEQFVNTTSDWRRIFNE